MPNWTQTLRIRGSKLGESDTFVDATVDDYAMSGHARLVEDTNTAPREWTVVTSKLDEWREEGDLADKGELSDSTHEIWTLIEELESNVGDPSLASAEGELQELVDQLFATTTEAQSN